MTTPEAKADRLTAALHENTEALNTVKNRYRWVIVGIVLLALTLGSVVYFNHEGNISQCESTNEIRAELNSKFQSIGDFLDTVISETPENQAFVELVGEDLSARDCSKVGWFTN